VNTDTAFIKKQKKRQKIDRQRIFRVVEYLDYSAVFEKSPVEVIEGYIVSDVDDYSIFASFVFRNVSKKRLKALDVRLLCYHNQNIPYLKIPFTYSYERYTLGTRKKGSQRIWDKKMRSNPVIDRDKSFGEAVYIPVPESYFSRLELEITGVRYADGSYEELSLIAGKRHDRFAELDNDKKFAYMTVNIYLAAEEHFPTRFIPQQGENAWLCCCGHKNSNENETCDKCKREKSWELENVTSEKLAEVSDRLQKDETAYFAHDKTKYTQTKYLETEEEVQRKIEQYELVMKKISEEERRREGLKTWIIPKVLLTLAAVYLFVFILQYLYEFFVKR